ncbi:MAG: hypothetical protein ACJ790_22075 [Myxococcaceae bacterium]
MAIENTEIEQPGIYPGETGPELPGQPDAEPELPTRRGNPERELPNLPQEPERELPRVPPNTPEAPPPHSTPQIDAPPVMT